ncbi:hypothetical protein FBQ83_10440 [Chloroflexi bacterium CFX5]|nr:hypothetical protein [Chloroflexi bacterium CFX5]
MMESFLTLHPDSTKKGVKIEKAKYDTMRNAILETLRRDGAMPFMEDVVLHNRQTRSRGARGDPPRPEHEAATRRTGFKLRRASELRE